MATTRLRVTQATTSARASLSMMPCARMPNRSAAPSRRMVWDDLSDYDDRDGIEVGVAADAVLKLVLRQRLAHG
jgi:hypothetical protein